MESAYRDELVGACPEAGDDVAFNRGITEASVTLVLLDRKIDALQNLLEEDCKDGISTNRQRALLRFCVVADTTEQFGHLEAVGAAFRQLSYRLQAIWSNEVEEMPLYPAFR